MHLYIHIYISSLHIYIYIYIHIDFSMTIRNICVDICIYKYHYRSKKNRKGLVSLCFHYPHSAQSCHFDPDFDQFNIDDEKVEACVAQTQEGHLVAMCHGGLKPHGSWTTFTEKEMCKSIEKFGAGQATQKQPGIPTQGVLASQLLSDLGEHSKKKTEGAKISCFAALDSPSC